MRLFLFGLEDLPAPVLTAVRAHVVGLDQLTTLLTRDERGK